ncbi:MAG TPA: acyltransferase [Solirubrobacteraceae bacterium]|jgi:peptidoglycan/LPS O-acetylase OafA/YrhL|nr:acyltransferase [Solirubrobacteraceae bacterium]
MSIPPAETQKITRAPRTRPPARGERSAAPTARGRVRQIDVVKGLAIIGVMVQHAFSSSILQDSWEILYAGQAVPIFFVIMGLNAAQSMARRRVKFLADLYDSDYVKGRVQRLVAPIGWIWPVALIAAVLVGAVHIGPLVLVGVLPISSAPGNYFVTIMLEFAVLFPAVFWYFNRAPVATTLVVAAADVGFELLAPHVHALGAAGPAHGYIYDAAIVKYGLAIMAGVWLSRVELGGRGLALLTLLALGSVVYLVVVHQDPNGLTWLVSSFSRTTNFISVFYAVWLTYMGIRLIPAQSSGTVYRALEKLGRASYHVFLVQIVWFGAITTRSWPMAIIGILACSAIGYAFYLLMTSRRPRKARPRRSAAARA